ncbi:MAG: hypothetical protein DRO36_02455 [Candidatus Hecatellales archaeon]|nr:MAG: hypothetical protein DRO36_02455 [Candidatus Hecatellales archaeon]
MVMDGRSNKVILVSHCIINSNSICIGPKTPSIWPAMINEVVEVLMRYKVGIVQLPCPEQLVYGFVREGITKTEMDTVEYRSFCRRIAEDAAELVKKYLENGFRVVGFLGKRASPSCGVKTTQITLEGRNVEVEGKGILVEELENELKKRGINLKLIDFERTEVEKCLRELEDMVKA